MTQQRILSVGLIVVLALSALLAVAELPGAHAQGGTGESLPPGRIVIGDEDGLYLLYADGTGKRYLEEESDPACWLRDGVWSPDGTQVMYSSICGGESPGDWRPDTSRTDLRERTANVFVVDVETGVSRELVPGDGVHQDYAGDWYPDGSAVVIYSDRDPSATFNFYRFDLQSGELTQLTAFDTSASRVSLDPSGRYLLYNRRIVDTGSIRFEVRAYDLTTGAEISVAEGITPNWSPDGQWIAWATEGAESDIFLMPSACIREGAGCNAARDAVNVTQSPGVAEREPVFSPDQTSLIYVRDTDDTPGVLTWDVFRHAIRTGLLENLTETPDVSERHRAWERVNLATTPVENVLPVIVRVSTTQGGANLREQPTTNGTIVGVLPVGTVLIVQSANADRTWYRVTLPQDGAEAWIYSQLITPVRGDLGTVPLAD